MTPCEALSDRMPDVALGRARWTPDEERHLGGCADCRAEWAIVTAASRLRPRDPVPLDPDRLASGALRRLAADRARGRARRLVWAAAGLAAAATIGVIVWAGRSGPGSLATGRPAPSPVATTAPEAPRSPVRRTESSHAAVELAMPELDSLPVEALDSMLRVLDEPLAQAADEPQAGDDGDVELERVLAGLEG